MANTKTVEFNLDLVPQEVVGTALRAVDEGDFFRIVGLVNSTYQMEFVLQNSQPLKSRGVYEKAFLRAFTGTRTNNLRWSPSELDCMFATCDRDKLRAAGSRLRRPGPFTVYRGVAGLGDDRRIAGWSWTDDLDRACWFAVRFGLDSPGVFSGQLTKDEVLAFINERQEREYIGLPQVPNKVELTEDEIHQRAAECDSRRWGEAVQLFG
jgi:hypothetical protein